MTTIFLIDAAECMPNAETWAEVWKEQEAWKAAKSEKSGEKPADNDKARGLPLSLASDSFSVFSEAWKLTASINSSIRMMSI